MAETIAFIGLAAAILQLLEPGRQIVTSIYHMNSEHQILEERNRSVNVLLSLLSYLGSDSSTLEDEALLHHKAELMVLKKQWDEMVANHGSGKLRKIKTWLKAFTSEKKMDRKLASSRNDINTLTLRTILEEIQRLRLFVEEGCQADLHTHSQLHDTYHVKNIPALINIGIELCEQGKFNDAQVVHEAALSGSEKRYGHWDPTTFLAMNTLGLSLQALGKHGSAHKLLVLALKRRQRYFYYEHPAALSSMSNVAISFQLQNQLEDANYWHAECYEIRRRVLGDDHLETLRSWSNIAVIAYLQKNLPRAEKIFRRVAQKLEIKLGLAHPDTIRAYLNWARCLRKRSYPERAESITLKVLRATRRKFGRFHWQTLVVKQSYSILLHGQGRLGKALRVATRVRDAKILQFGEDDPRTQFSKDHVQQLEEECYLRATSANPSNRS